MPETQMNAAPNAPEQLDEAIGQFLDELFHTIERHAAEQGEVCFETKDYVYSGTRPAPGKIQLHLTDACPQRKGFLRLQKTEKPDWVFLQEDSERHVVFLGEECIWPSADETLVPEAQYRLQELVLAKLKEALQAFAHHDAAEASRVAEGSLKRLMEGINKTHGTMYRLLRYRFSDGTVQE